jgi:hypothetical protein
MRRFNTFMIGFASVFTSIAGCVATFGEVVSQSIEKPVKNSPKHTGIDYFDGFKKDRAALASDWGKVGGDFRRAINEYVETNEGTASPNI